MVRIGICPCLQKTTTFPAKDIKVVLRKLGKTRYFLLHSYFLLLGDRERKYKRAWLFTHDMTIADQKIGKTKEIHILSPT